MKTTKYRNIKTVIDGITFDSRKEANYYNTLKLLKRSGNVINIEFQPEFPYVVNCYHPTDLTAPTFTKNYKYIADFRVTYSDGSVQIIDVKGVKTAEFKRKQKIELNARKTHV